ncbi:hypothetical protein [Tropicimonas aquimaris]|uniref:YMGG-like Gly-zipper domain-containing protein n=1 Tax=Tropicimonas aquimaris TaxID=914152 RepID=A0ABW3IQG7_9RHOB
MAKPIKLASLLACIALLAACEGNSNLENAAIGAGAGAGVSALTGTNLGTSVAVGAAAGALSNDARDAIN